MARAVPRRRDRRARRRRRRLAVARSSLLGFVGAPDRAARPPRSRNRGGAATRCSRCSARSSRTSRTSFPISLVGRVRAAAPDPELLLLPRRHGRARVRPVQRPLFLNLLLRRRSRARRVRPRRLGTLIAIPDLCRDRHRRAAGRRLFRESPPRRMVFVGFARRRCSACSWSIGVSMPNVWLSALSSRSAPRLRIGRVRDPPRRRLDGHPLPAPVPRHRDDRRSTCSSSARSSAPCSPACSATRSAPAPRRDHRAAVRRSSAAA